MLQKTIGNAKIYDGHGRTSEGADSFYSPMTGIITMSQEDMQRPEVLWHEYGHYLDDPDESGCYSRSHTNAASGSEHKVSLSQSLYDDNAMHSEQVASDMNKFLTACGVEGYTVEASPYGSYLIIKGPDGRTIESSDGLDLSNITSAFDKNLYLEPKRAISTPLVSLR